MSWGRGAASDPRCGRRHACEFEGRAAKQGDGPHLITRVPVSARHPVRVRIMAVDLDEAAAVAVEMLAKLISTTCEFLSTNRATRNFEMTNIPSSR